MDIPLYSCNLCLKELPRTSEYFQSGKGHKDGLNPRCRKCCSRRQMELRKTAAVRHAHDEAMRQASQRRCRVCEQYKPATLDYFCVRNCNSTGLNSMCKACQAEQNASTYKARKNDPILAAKDARKNAERTKRWTRKNPDKVRLIQRNYRESHAETFRIHARRRDALKASLPHDFTEKDWQFALDWWGGCCAYCGRPTGLFHKLAMDHFIPLTGSNCIGTIPSNILPACHNDLGCNNRKSNKQPESWIVDTFGKIRGRDILAKVHDYFSQVRQTLR